ncbi:MAG: xanthine dehydrogenase accessory protein XdhC [Betaproteobacteria bacterium]
MVDWITALRERIVRDGRAILVTIAHASGSTPRDAGTTMVVTAHDVAGTIGGGHLEFEALRIARDALTLAESVGAWIVRFPLAARLGQCCGGVATLAFSVVQRSDMPWLDAAAACLRTHTIFVLISRVGEHGAPMVVSLDNVAGSLGTPEDNSTAIALARTHIVKGHSHAMLVAPAMADASTLLLQMVQPNDFSVLLFGNGHVGRALVRIFGTLPASVRWIDGREHDFPTDVDDNIETVITDDPLAELATAPHGACVIIMTHSHALDYDLVETALRRDDWQFLGLIGSQSKRNQFEKRLAARGTATQALQRIVCPIGAQPGVCIRSKEPGAIAVAVAAQLLALREARGTGVETDDASRRVATGEYPSTRNRTSTLRTITHRTRRP